MTTKIIPCKCRNGFQDQKYGNQNRVHNQTKQNSPVERRQWRCTVCGEVK